MDDLEQKLNNYFQNNPYYQPEAIRADLTRELKALASDPPAAKKPRRRYALPLAAALAAVLLFAVGLIWFRAPHTDDIQTPEQVQTEPGQSLAADEQPPAPEEPASPAEKPADKPAAPATDEARDDEPAPEREAGQAPRAPAPASEPPAAPAAPEAPAQENEAAPPEAPVEPEAPPEAQEAPKPDEPEPANQDPPADPIPDEPAPAEEPPAPEPPAAADVGAVYQMEDGRETLTLTLMSTGESVELDVTGWEEQPEPAPDVPPGRAAYSGSNPIVNFIFEKNITYYLTRDDDGTVRVDLDVADTGNGTTEKGEEP